MKNKAFTLIEITIVVVIVALLTMGVALSFRGIQEKTIFEQQENELTNMVQKARSLSLSSRLIEDTYQVDHYELKLTASAVSLTAYGKDESAATVSEQIDNFSLDESYILELSGQTSLFMYYFPPDGELCTSSTLSDCSSSAQELNFYLTQVETQKSIEFAITTKAGYLEKVTNIES